jgi:hypothetical protein
MENANDKWPRLKFPDRKRRARKLRFTLCGGALRVDQAMEFSPPPEQAYARGGLFPKFFSNGKLVGLIS